VNGLFKGSAVVSGEVLPLKKLGTIPFLGYTYLETGSSLGYKRRTENRTEGVMLLTAMPLLCKGKDLTEPHHVTVWQQSAGLCDAPYLQSYLIAIEFGTPVREGGWHGGRNKLAGDLR
jgi:hypothetical protein